MDENCFEVMIDRGIKTGISNSNSCSKTIRSELTEQGLNQEMNVDAPSWNDSLQAETITVQFGSAANDVGVHYWNAVTASLAKNKQNMRLRSLVHDKESCIPNLVIFDRCLGFQQILEYSEENMENASITADQNSWLKYNSSPINSLHYHPVPVGKDANIFQNTTNLDEAFEESVRSVSEKLDCLKYFQMITEATSAFADTCHDSLILLQDLYPKRQTLAISLVEHEPKLPLFATSLTRLFEASTSLLLLDTINTLESNVKLASFIDTMNTNGFPWMQSSSIYHASFNHTPLFNNLTSSKFIGIARNSLEEADISIPEPAYLTKLPNGEGCALEIECHPAFTQLYRNSPELRHFLRTTFHDNPIEFSSHAFKTMGADTDLYIEVNEGIHKIIEACLPHE